MSLETTCILFCLILLICYDKTDQMMRIFILPCLTDKVIFGGGGGGGSNNKKDKGYLAILPAA